MGGSHGHCRVYAILAGLIICGGHHATRTVIAHHNRMAQECRIVMFFERYEERIHVYMYYLAYDATKIVQKGATTPNCTVFQALLNFSLNQDTLYVYSPGMQVTIISASENYRGICLLVDEHQALDTDTVRNMIRIAYLPVIRLSEPVIAIPKDLAVRLANRMEEFIYYLKSDNGNKEIIMQHLYALFLLDLQSALNVTVPTESLHKRTEEIFIGFIRMLPQNFVR